MTWKDLTTARTTARAELTPEEQATVDDAKNPITTRFSGIIPLTTYECRGAAETALGVVTRRWRSHDMSSVRIPLKSRKYPGLYAIVDEQDADLVRQYTWHPVKPRHTFYAEAYIAGPERHAIYMHRLITGSGKGQQVDHGNGDGLDNTRDNLRVCDNSRNQSNRRMDRRSTSGFKGVSWSNRRNHWIAYISKDMRRIHLGSFQTSDEAARAYDAAAREMFGEFARTNEDMGLITGKRGGA